MRAYRVKVIVRNNFLLSAIEAAGYASQSDFARSIDTEPQYINALVALRKSPLTDGGEFSEVAKRIMEALGAAPSDLWSDEQLTMRLNRNSGERTVDGDVIGTLLEEHNEAMLLPDPESLAMDLERKDVVDAALSQLSEREQQVIAYRFAHDMTFADIGRKMNLCRESVRQIETRALRKLRHPRFSHQLAEV